MAGDLIDPLSAAGIAQAAVARSLDAQRGAEGSATAAAASAKAAGDALAATRFAMASGGVVPRWSGSYGTVLSILQPGGTWSPGVDLRGPAGGVGPAPNIRIGNVIEGDFAVVRQPGSPDAAPVLDFALRRGLAAWTPVLAVVADGARRVHQVVDWTGGGGTKPATGSFIGPAGLVAAIGDATDLRGAPGPAAVSFVGASSTPLPIAIGAVSLVVMVPAGAGYAPTLYQALVSAADPHNAMVGVLTGYDATSGTLSLAIQQAAGSGTHADWIVTSTPPLFVGSGIDGGYAGDPMVPAGATPVYGASASSGSGVDGGYG